MFSVLGWVLSGACGVWGGRIIPHHSSIHVINSPPCDRAAGHGLVVMDCNKPCLLQYINHLVNIQHNNNNDGYFVCYLQLQ